MTKDKRYGIIFFVLVIILALASIAYKLKLRNLSQTYVIGTITRHAKSPSGGHYINYTYTLNGKKYSTTRNYDRVAYDVSVDQNYLVAVPKNHEDHGFLLLSSLLPDSLSMPDEGWDELPPFCSTKAAKKELRGW